VKHTHLGRSGLKVPRLWLGTMDFGPQKTDHIFIPVHHVRQKTVGRDL
jgi:aryl-alcohol dehydrogenase-like predicted oxidoreductase